MKKSLRARLREFFQHFQINESIAQLWNLLFVNVILSLIPFVVAAPVPVTLVLAAIAGLSIVFHVAGLRIYSSVAIILGILVGISLKSMVPGGTFSGQYICVLFSAVTLFKTFDVRKYGDGQILLILTLGTNSTVLLMSPDSSLLVSVWSLLVTLWTIVNLLRINLRNLSSVALIASIRSALIGVLYTLPLLIFLFYFFQKFSHMSLYSRGDSNMSGISQTLEPGNVENLTKNSAVAFRAVMDRREFPFVSLYWKGPTLDHSLAMRWKKGMDSGLESPPRLGLANMSDPCLVEQTIYIQGADLSPYRLALDSPIPSLYSSVSSNTYHTTSKICHEDRIVKTDPAGFKRELEVDAEISPEVKELVRELSRGTHSPREFASRLYKYFRVNKFKYSLTPPVLSPFHALDDFLFVKKIGFCEHFAASFATLARLTGYPARIVTGFQGGKYNEFGNYWVVGYKDAHAWVELWDKKLGWVQMDPTSIVAPERIEKGAEAWTNLAQPWWEKVEDNEVWQAGDAFLFWVRGLFDHRDTLVSLDDLTVSTTQLVALAFALSLLLVVRRARRNYDVAVNEQFKKLCRVLDENTLPRGRAEGFEHYRARLVQWMNGQARLKGLVPATNLVFQKRILYLYGNSSWARADLRLFYSETKAIRRSLRLKTGFLVKLLDRVYF